MFYLEPESKKKISGAGAEEKWLGSATLVESLLLSEPEPAKKKPEPVKNGPAAQHE